MVESSLLLEGFQIVMAFLSPVIVAVIGYKATRLNEETKKINEMQQELNKNKEQQVAEKFEKIEGHIEELSSGLAAIKSECAGIEDDIDIITQQVEFQSQLLRVYNSSSNNVINLCDALTSSLVKYYQSQPEIYEAIKEYENSKKAITTDILSLIQSFGSERRS